MNEQQLVNPDGILLPQIEEQLSRWRKTQSLWATPVDQSTEITGLEGMQQIKPGDWLCWGIVGEPWPQSDERLHRIYIASGITDDKGRERFDPRPDASTVEAVQMKPAFRVVATWGELHGKPGDFVVRSMADSKDVWVVDQKIFKASYGKVPGPDAG